MIILGILLSIYIVSALIVIVFAALGNVKGLSDKDAADLIFCGCIPAFGTLTAVLVLVYSIVYRGEK